MDSLSMLYYTSPLNAALLGFGFVTMELETFDWSLLESTNLKWMLALNGLLV
jgi:hypothetical protein